MRVTVSMLVAIWTAAACGAGEIHVDADSSAATPDGSRRAPYRTIADALKLARPGDTVVVRAGLYRESVRLPGGEKGRPVSLKAAAGERVVLSGARPVTQWKPHRDGVYTAVLDFRPKRLLLGRRPLPLARTPNEGWWLAEKAEGTAITDAKHLRVLACDPAGGEAYIWTTHGNTFFAAPVASLDREAGKLTVVRKSKWMKLGPGDRYYLRNHPDFIDRPGEWAVQADGKRYRLYCKPARRADLLRLEAPREPRRVLGVFAPGHVRIEGLEVAASAGSGIDVGRCEDVVIRGCISHGHGRTGIALRDVRGVAVRRCICLGNYCGITLHAVVGAVIEENEIARNGMDGLILSWGTSDVTVRRNYIHHHLLWGHPDNVQLYRGVKNVRFVDNLLLAGGQSIMMEETSDGLIQGNTIVGCGAYSVIFGHGNAEKYRILNNTIALAGYGCLSLTARDYDLRENVLVTGHGSFLFGLRGVKGYRGDRNLLFNAPGLERVGVVASDEGWHRSFEEYRRAAGYDANSVYGDPRFRSAPAAFAVVDHRRLTECTRERLLLRRGGGPIRLGDTVELDFDGVARKVTAADRASITICPPLPARPLKCCLVANWGRRADLTLDLRLAADSPGAKLSASGGPVGSLIDIAAYRRGDFDGDGKRDLPPLPRPVRGVPQSRLDGGRQPE